VDTCPHCGTEHVPNSCFCTARGKPLPTALLYAGFWRRLAAALLDTVVLFLPFVIASFFIIVTIKLLGSPRYPTASLLFWPPIIGLLGLSCFSLLESSSWRATIGKLVLGLYVTDASGRPLTFPRSLTRNLAKVLSALTLGIGFFSCGLTSKKQALHDFAARALVLRRR
jgi:uncharacterized RDD family membrane protein YckC